MDRAYFAFGWLVDVDTRGTHFVVRVKTGSRALKLKRLKKLGAGEHTAHLLCPPYLKRERPQLPDVLLVRVVTYQRTGYRPVTVVTNLLDRERFPAKAVGALYHDRWEIELGYRELKIHLGEERVIFRSHTPERVLQEAYGLLIAYNCVRALMAEAAAEIGIEPRFLSFMDCLERIRWAVRDMARADPRELPALHAELVGDLALCRLPPRRSDRRCERAVKIKMSNFARKRRGKPAATSRQRRRGQTHVA